MVRLATSTSPANMEAPPTLDARHESSSAANASSNLELPHHNDEEQLADRIQALAEELQDMILDYTLIAGLEKSKDKTPTNKILLTSRYRFPWQLHLNRRTRKLVAQHYFANSIFQLDFREAEETCLYNLLAAVEDVNEYRDAVRESCGYELEESIFHIGVERIPKKREGRKRYIRAYTVKKAREIGDSPYSQYAHLDRPIPRGD